MFHVFMNDNPESRLNHTENKVCGLQPDAQSYHKYLDGNPYNKPGAENHPGISGIPVFPEAQDRTACIPDPDNGKQDKARNKKAVKWCICQKFQGHSYDVSGRSGHEEYSEYDTRKADKKLQDALYYKYQFFHYILLGSICFSIHLFSFL